MERDHQTTLPVVLITWCLCVCSISRSLAADAKVIGSSQPIVAVAGDDVILPCSLEPLINAEHMTVEWSRPDINPKHVHVYRDGRHSVGDQNSSHKNRTSLFKEELINGNVSLKLSRVKLEDQGNYSCFIPTYSRDKQAVIQLNVVAVPEPKISILETKSAAVVLQCEAEGWYSELQLEWKEGPKDSEGRLLSADVTQTHSGPDGCNTVRSNMTVQKTDTNMFTCRVQLMKFNLTREAEFHVSVFELIEEAHAQGFNSGLLVSVLVCGVVGVGVAVLIYLWKKGFIKFPGGKNTPQEKTKGVEEESLNDKKETN